MLPFFRYFGRLYITTVVAATLTACAGPSTTVRPSAPPPEPGRPEAGQAPAPGRARTQPSPAGTSAPVLALKEKPRDLAREREELLKYEEGVRLFREENRPEEALQVLDGFLRMHPDSSYADDALLEQARIWMQQEEPRRAMTSLRQLLDRYPATPLKKKAFILMMNIQRSEEKWKDCLDAAENALSLSPSADEAADILTVSGVCRTNRRDLEGGAADIVRAYRMAESEGVRARALQVWTEVTSSLKDKQIEDLLQGSDGGAPYGLLAMTLLRRDLEKGLYKQAMAELMDLLVHYPDQVPAEQVETIYAGLRDRLMVKTDIIGAVLPLSGRYGVFGQKALQGIQAALDFQTATPPEATSNPFTLVVKDSGGDPVQAAQAVRDLAETQQVIAIIGPVFSRTTRAAAEAAEESGTPMISLSPDPEIPGLSKNVFRRSLVDDQQVSALVRLVSGRLMMSRFAFLYPDDAYGREMMHQFWDQLDKRGGQVVAVESFPPGQTDFGPQIRAMVGLNRPLTPEEQRLKEKDPNMEMEPIIDFDALFIPADFQTVGLLAPQLAFYDVNEVLLLGTDGWNSPWLVELGEHYVEGAIFTGGYVQDLAKPQVRDLVESYWLTFGEDPQSLAVQAYDAARMIRRGVESGLVRDRSGMREYFMNLKDFPSAEGPLTTNEEGDIQQRPYLLTVVDGEIVPYEIELD